MIFREYARMLDRGNVTSRKLTIVRQLQGDLINLKKSLAHRLQQVLWTLVSLSKAILVSC